LQQVKTTRAGQGDQNIAIIEFAQPAQDAWGCGHPNGATHVIMAGVLKQALTKIWLVKIAAGRAPRSSIEREGAVARLARKRVAQES